MCGLLSGVLLDRSELERASALCGAVGAWLVVDNTYEHFTYDGCEHACVSGPHIVNLYSFSKVGGAGPTPDSQCWKRPQMCQRLWSRPMQACSRGPRQHRPSNAGAPVRSMRMQLRVQPVFGQ